MYASPFDIFLMLPKDVKTGIQEVFRPIPRPPIRRITLTLLGALLFGVAPSQAYTIFSGVDSNGNPMRNLLPNIPNSTAASNAFLADLQGVGTETFESMQDDQAVPLILVFPGAGSATLDGANAMIRSTRAGSTTGSGRYGVSPSHYLEVRGSSIFTIKFSQPVAAFGFFGVDIGDFSGILDVTFNTSAIGLLSIPLAPMIGADGSVIFYGIIGEPGEEFTSVAFHTQGAADMFAFDNMTIGSRSQVIQNNPAAPGPLGVLGLGSSYLWWRRLRKRTRT